MIEAARSHEMQPPLTTRWAGHIWPWGFLAAAIGLLLMIFSTGLAGMLNAWSSEEYSHGYMLPAVAAFLVWQRSALLAQTPFQPSWTGVMLTAFGLFLYVAGELGTLYTVIQYGFLAALGGVLLSWMGWKAFRIILPAYLLLFFCVPLPSFLYNNLSSQLQLTSSEWGVALIRLFSIPVFLEGNVIDLGHYQLQVVEACSGLRYLFPLSALGFIAAILFRGALWKKAVLFFSTLPITVLMNSFRIGVIGILVHYQGIDMAEGFLHDFEGWVVFMACSVLLVLEMWLLARIGPDRSSFSEAFTIDGPEPIPDSARVEHRRVPWSVYAVLPLLVAVALLSFMLPERQDVAPQRPDLVFFPGDIGEWRGQRGRLEQIYIDALKFDDYLMSDYRNQAGDSINLYVAYYASQRKGASVHSPKSCLPGGGWRIEDFSQREIPGPGVDGQPLRVNRSLIQMGDERLLVYYWFQQRGRVMTNEYLVKWYLFWDALTRNRTDGALVRLTIAAPLEEDLKEKDALLSGFANAIEPPLQRFIPE
ncbi:VPLPA-CTERM-specific exosortase XrtD [Imhoffiella purpurea]|uniref:Eight transmembrane protein EpsH / EpsI protein n=1 Tax=Imhoffiella purpurea TaxID=1249627 RepID=W9V301_9GAMM|nr:VPLPA-CTERM-specific exosortase XrtD [Imhoffiella purpurea]EXJ13853.1 Eight transmembrane protein EpsH / EpsI protein [Imhoffiella purpurea]